MRKVHVLVAVPAKGPMIAEVGDNLAPLVERAKAIRASGMIGKVACPEVHVLSSLNFGAMRFRCEKPVAPKPAKED